MEKVSIVVPVYNVAAYLRRCLDSLVAQTYPNVEILMVDDCSTDDSAAIAREYAEKYPGRCIFVPREKNGGVSAARNTGIDAATGEWLTFVDSDDWISTDCVETLHDVALRDGAEIVMSNFVYAYASGAEVEVSTFGELTAGSSHREKVALADSCPTTRLYRRSLFTETGIRFPEDIWRSEDIATVIPLLTVTDKISLVPKAMYYYFQRAASRSNRNTKNVDVSFYPKTIARMVSLSRSGFEAELQFRAVHELMYGMIMIMVRSGRTRAEVSAQVEDFNVNFPGWRENPYFERLPFGKRVFIRCAAKKWYGGLKCLIWAWDLKQRLTARQQG